MPRHRRHVEVSKTHFLVLHMSLRFEDPKLRADSGVARRPGHAVHDLGGGCPAATRGDVHGLALAVRAQGMRATVTFLRDAAQPATDQTKHAIGTRLRALPGDEPLGRLSRTLQPAGFGILTGLSVAAGAGRPASPAPRGGAATSASRPKVD